MKGRPRINWTFSQIGMMRKFITSGLSVKEVLETPEFKGRTRNSIIGMCYREEIPLTKKPNKPKRGHPVLENNKEPIAVSFPPSKPKAKAKELRVSLLTARDGQCRYLVGGEAEDGTKIVCGFPSVRGSYCTEHYRITHHQDKT
jgi:hypothetical protein